MTEKIQAITNAIDPAQEKKWLWKQIRGRCIALWPKVIKARAYNGMCERKCGRPGLFAHHVILCIREKFRFEILNGAWVCKECHGRAHLDLTGFAERLDGERVAFNRKNRDDTSVAKRYADDYERIYTNLKDELERRCGRQSDE